MRMFESVLSHDSTNTPTELVAPLQTMLTSAMSESDEFPFAPCLMWSPTSTFLIETHRTFVSRPESMEMPFATSLPSMMPPENE